MWVRCASVGGVRVWREGGHLYSSGRDDRETHQTCRVSVRACVCEVCVVCVHVGGAPMCVC